jgi:hypothetical protein
LCHMLFAEDYTNGSGTGKSARGRPVVREIVRLGDVETLFEIPVRGGTGVLSGSVSKTHSDSDPPEGKIEQPAT